jgi:hypothetical protein
VTARDTAFAVAIAMGRNFCEGYAFSALAGRSESRGSVDSIRAIHPTIGSEQWSQAGIICSTEPVISFVSTGSISPVQDDGERRVSIVSVLSEEV